VIASPRDYYLYNLRYSIKVAYLTSFFKMKRLSTEEFYGIIAKVAMRRDGRGVFSGSRTGNGRIGEKTRRVSTG